MQRLRKFGTAMLLALFAGALSFAIRDSVLAERAGWIVYDYLQRQTPPVFEEDLVIVQISQRALDEFKENPDLKLGWPWPREVYSALMATANELKAKSVAFDMLFDSPSVYGVEDDKKFGQAIQKFPGPVVFPAPTNKAFHKPNPQILEYAGPRVLYGSVTLPVEIDGTYRRVPLLTRGIDGVSYSPLGVAALNFEQQDRELWIRFPSSETVPTVDISEVFRLYQAHESGVEADAKSKAAAVMLTGRHWIVGLSAAGLYDLRPTPTDERAPGSFIHAATLMNGLHSLGLKPLTSGMGAFICFCICLLAMLIILNASRAWPAIFGGFGSLSVGLVTLVGGLWSKGLWFNPMPTLAVAGSLSGLALTYRFQREWLERERLAKTVQNSMSKEMVELIRLGQLNLSRFGERREISILFSDLSGFTSLSETTAPEQLVEILNLYLDEAVELIFEYQGFVDKFIGDAVMALWGAPMIGQTNHAALALNAAIGFSSCVQRFNMKASDRFGVKEELFRARVGLHSGPAIVGNIGSKDRYNYTAIGDTVNLASRLEGLGKYYEVYLLISGDALKAAGEIPLKGLFEVDCVAVKGRQAPVTIFSVAANADQSELEFYAKGLRFYRERKWAEAREYFSRAPAVESSRVMRERCERAQDGKELPQFKDGVWHHDEK